MSDTLKRVLLVVGYNGANYYGYQKQETLPTIQGTLEKALKDALDEDIIIHASGRTDRGVHANHQTIHFDTSTQIPTSKLKKILNAYLPEDIYIYSVKDVPNSFHARYNVTKKEYIYKLNTNHYDPILAHLYWFVPPFDVPAFKSALKDIIGTHDFFAFSKRPQTKNTMRTVEAIQVIEKDGIILVSIIGDGFLRYMVRNIIGACLAIASQEAKYTISDIFNTNNNQLIKTLAQPGGLYLNNVMYETNYIMSREK